MIVLLLIKKKIKQYKQCKEKLIFTLIITKKEILNHGRDSKNWLKLNKFFEITYNI